MSSLVCEIKQVVDQASLVLEALFERMPCSALPGGMSALIYDLGEPVEETPILEGRKDGKGTTHHAAISLPTGSRESFEIALEDHAIKCARVTGFDPKLAVASGKKVANIGG